MKFPDINGKTWDLKDLISFFLYFTDTEIAVSY